MSKRTDKENYVWFTRNYPFYTKIDKRKNYIYYKSIVDNMGLGRPDWSRFVWESYEDEEEYWGFKEEKNLLMFKLAIGENK